MVALLVLVTIALYWPATRCDFVNYDDNVYVVDNAHLTGGLTWENLKWAFFKAEAQFGYWHPLTLLSHMADCQLFGLKPRGHHLTSVLLHALNTALVFLLLRRLTGTLWRSVLVAALFGWHPLHVESVAWVAERKDVLSTFFGLLSLLGYARYAEERKHPTSNIQPRTFNERGWYWLALVAFALGLMSKPMLVTLPFVMLLLDYWPLGRFTICDLRFTNIRSVLSRGPWSVVRGPVCEKLPFLALAAAASVATIVVSKQGDALAEMGDLTLGARVGNTLVSYCRYLGKTFWPADLAVFYPHPGHWPLEQVLLAGGLLAGISALLFMMRRQYPVFLVGWLWFVGTLVPAIGLVQVGSFALADRYTYIPSLGLLLVVIWGGSELARRWQRYAIALWVVGGAAIGVCLVLTRQQLGHWRDSEALFGHALAVTENNHVAHNHLGDALLGQGRIDEAIGHFQEAVRMEPAYAKAHNNLGAALARQGQPDKAIRHYQEALRLNPANPEAHNNLGIALGKKGQTAEAIRHYQEALRLKPRYAEACNNLATALNETGQIDEAIRQYLEALHLNPDIAEAHYNLGNISLGRGQIDEGIRHYQEALRLNPGLADAHNNLGGAFATKGRIDEAIGHFQEAVRLKPDNARARRNLAAVLALKGGPAATSPPAMKP